MDNNVCQCKGKKVSALVLALGIGLGGFFPGYFYYHAKMDSNYVTVKGLSEMNVRADLAVWDLKFVVTGNDLKTAQAQMSSQLGMVLGFLKNMGFSEDEIAIGRIETNDLMANPYRNNEANGVRYILTQGVQVRSTNVDNVAKALNSTAVLISQGIVFDNQSYGSPVSYIFTKLNDIKPQMLEEATKNAQAAAAEFAKSSNSTVGKIKYANQGVFSILPSEQTAGASESSQIEKKVRVVSTVEYWLK